MTNREIALDNEILRGVVGSTAHGTAIEGQDDRDEMGIFVEPREVVCGLTSIDHYLYRDQPQGVRSQPGDLDLTIYSLRKFCKLAVAGNPSILMLLWLPNYLTRTDVGSWLIDIRQSFVSKKAGLKYLGYLTAQKKSLTGERNLKVNRPELILRYGFDTKFAMHALRLGYQGLELLQTRQITLPVAEPALGVLRNVRTGEYTYDHTLKLIEEAEAKLREAVDSCTYEADAVTITDAMVDIHYHHWEAPSTFGAHLP